ncbi:MAG: hypothetical protein R3F11_14885 [Verrucomicrobiales bacterium]
MVDFPDAATENPDEFPASDVEADAAQDLLWSACSLDGDTDISRGDISLRPAVHPPQRCPAEFKKIVADPKSVAEDKLGFFETLPIQFGPHLALIMGDPPLSFDIALEIEVAGGDLRILRIQLPSDRSTS